MRWIHRFSPWRRLFDHAHPSAVTELFAPLKDVLDAAPSAESPLTHAYQWQQRLVETLSRYDLPAWRMAQLISDHNAWLYRHAISRSLEEMQSQGWGPPPADYCVLILGSGARDESLLGPDQDNALIIEDYPDSRHVEIDGYFQALGERFTQRLAEAGIPLCQGHVMARWPMWRKRLGEWRAQLDLWTQERRVKRVQQTNILLDFTPVAGEARLAQALSQSVADIVPKRALFMDEMAALLDELPVALDRLGRLKGSVEEAPYADAINLKRQGLMPLVSAVRLLSLHAGVSEVSTRKRLQALGHHSASGLTRGQAEELVAILERLQQLTLDQQRHNLALGQVADGWVDSARLRDDQTHMLKYDLKQIRHCVSHVQSWVRAGAP
ncbi:signal transduction protein [Halomonas alkaliantarctica]|nr:signal transduction protein [Halomonas alkaliantarctica]